MPNYVRDVQLVEITTDTFAVDLDIRYATADNITGAAIYQKPRCYLRTEAAEKLHHAIALAQGIGIRLCLFDGYRPLAAQEKLWQACPDPDYIVPPEIGSNHTRGIAIDMTLLDVNGTQLDMGTGFDDMSECSHHGNQQISIQAQHNRYLLRGLMASAGWHTLPTEWWHYQLPGDWPLISEKILSEPFV